MQVNLDLKFWDNPLFLHEGREESRNFGQAWNDDLTGSAVCMTAWLCFMRNGKEAPDTTSVLIQAETWCWKGAQHREQAQFECALIKAHTGVVYAALQSCTHIHISAWLSIFFYPNGVTIWPSSVHLQAPFRSLHPSTTSFPPPMLLARAGWLRAAKLLLHAILWYHTVITFTHPAEEEEEEEEVGRVAEEWRYNNVDEEEEEVEATWRKTRGCKERGGGGGGNIVCDVFI